LITIIFARVKENCNFVATTVTQTTKDLAFYSCVFIPRYEKKGISIQILTTFKELENIFTIRLQFRIQ